MGVAPSAGGGGSQQNLRSLLIGCDSARSQRFGAGAADWMLDEREREIGQAERACDHFARRLEGEGADRQRRLGQLLERNRVVHTARRAGASIAHRGDQKIDILAEVAEQLRVSDS